MKYFIAILISTLAISVNSHHRICGENENSYVCSSKCKDLTCKKLYSDQVTECPDICEDGCFCNEGFARNADNVCVDVAECARE